MIVTGHVRAFTKQVNRLDNRQKIYLKKIASAISCLNEEIMLGLLFILENDCKPTIKSSITTRR